MKSRALVASALTLFTQKLSQFPGNDHNDNINLTPLHRVTLEVDRLIETYKDTVGAPGISVCVSVGATTVYCKGFGFADVEQGVRVTPLTKFRIASISKSFTSLLVGRMIDQGRLNLDEDTTAYLPDFSLKTQDGKPASITMRHLLSHTSGIRHYKKSVDGKEKDSDQYSEEILNTKAFDSAQDSLAIFRDDPLINPPGENYHYSTYGFTAVAAVLEAIMAKSNPFKPLFERPTLLNEPSVSDCTEKLPAEAKSSSLFKHLFAFLGLQNTCLDEPFEIIPFRASPYRRDKKKGSRLSNTPWVNNSCKWSGGGLLSTAPDLVHFGNHLIDIYMDRFRGMEHLAVVSRNTLVNCLWYPNHGTVQGRWLPGGLYGLGWFVARRSTTPADKPEYLNKFDRLYVGHTGGAVGFTSVLLMSLPIITVEEYGASGVLRSPSHLPPICLAILVNLEDARGIGSLAIHVTEAFTKALLNAGSGSPISLTTDDTCTSSLPAPIAA